MTNSSNLTQVRQWRELLLEAPIPAGLASAMPEFLKQVGQEFLATVPASVSMEDHRLLERWYVSNEGQAVLVTAVKRLWSQMTWFSEHAMPAHDARHAMFKVPAAALEYMAAESVQGWERVGVIGALLHDHGRWAEERLYGRPGDSLIHARLSFLLGRELFEDLPMPEVVRQHILLAAVRHTSGAHPEDPMPLKITVSADRDQLYGPEIVLRLAHHIVDPEDQSMSSFYGEKPGMSVLGKLEQYLVCRLPGPLFSRDAHVDHLWSVLATFLLLALPPDDCQKAFTRIARGHASGRPLPKFNWEQEWELANEHRPASKGPAASLMALLSAPNVAPSLRYKQEALDKLSALSSEQGSLLSGALAYVEEERWVEDMRQAAALKQIARDNPSDRMVQMMCSLLLQGWNGAENV